MGHRVACPDFVGRTGELGLLQAAFDAMEGGHASTVLVGGDAGIGKTRLVDEFCTHVRAGDVLVAIGACVPVGGEGLPYGPVIGILRDLTRQLGQPDATQVLGSLASGLEFADKSRLFESVLTAVTRLAERSPVVLVFEDLQWADSASAELLSFLTRNLTGSRVLVVGTYRTEELGRDHPLRGWLTELVRDPRVTQVLLEGFDRAQVAALIAGILGREPDWVLVDAVWTRSQGNAFFAEELTASRHSPLLPPGLQGVIMARVEGLTGEAQELLQVVAAAGTTVEHQLLVAVGAIASDPEQAALAETVDSQILVVDPTGSGYQFRHALLREAVDSSALPGERSRLHRQIAVALTADPSLAPTEPGHRAAELAVHWWAAGQWVEALDASITAADSAVALWAFPEALAHLERALSAVELVPAGTVEVDRIRLLEQASDAAYLVGDSQRAVDLAQAAIDEVDAVADPAHAARLLVLLGRNAWGLADAKGAFAAYGRAAALLPAGTPSVELARVLAEEARGLMLLSRYGQAELRCQQGLVAAAAVEARAEEGHLTYTLGVCRASLGHYDEGIELVRQALAIAEDLANPDDVNRAYMGLSNLLMESGRLEESAALVFSVARPGEDTWGIRLGGAAGNGVEALIRLGRHEEAEALLAQVGDRGVGSVTARPSLLRAMLALRVGRFEEAARWLVRADELTPRLADVRVRGVFHMLSAELALLQGRPQEGYAAAELALALAAPTDDEEISPEMCALAVRALADHLDQARATGAPFDSALAQELALGHLEQADRLVEAPGARGGRCAPRSAAMAAMCAAERSRLDEPDGALWAAAAQGWDAAGEPSHATYCRWREAEARLERRGGRAEAAAPLQGAWRTAEDLGMVALREQIERLGARARIPLGPDAPAAAAPVAGRSAQLGLTRRETEVLGHLAAGRTDREIADALYISKKTASVHVSNILRKLAVTNRIEAGKIGQAHGLGQV